MNILDEAAIANQKLWEEEVKKDVVTLFHGWNWISLCCVNTQMANMSSSRTNDLHLSGWPIGRY